MRFLPQFFNVLQLTNIIMPIISAFTPAHQNANSSHIQPNNYKGSYVLVELTTGKEIAEIRYYSTKSSYYAAFWHNPSGAIGTGKATTEGTHEAIFRAAKCAGISFAKELGYTPTEILQAFAAHLGKTCTIIHTHG